LLLDDGEFQYEIEFCLDPDPDDSRCLGTQNNPTREEPGRIKIKSDLPRFRLLHTLMHELGHCAEYKADTSIHDDVIDMLARYYTNVLLKNPAIINLFLPLKAKRRR